MHGNIRRMPLILIVKLVRASGIEPLTPTMSRWARTQRKSLIYIELVTSRKSEV